MNEAGRDLNCEVVSRQIPHVNAVWFVPSAICFCVAVFGLLVGVIALAFLLRRNRRAAAPDSPQAAPPILTSCGKRSGVVGVLLKCLVGFGAAMLMAGSVGLWQTGLTVAWAGKSDREWSARRAPELEAIIRKHCAPFIRNGKSIGLTVAVATATNSTIMSFGRTSLVLGREPRDDSLFELGSITKTFTATLLAREIDRGAVTLEEPVQELLPPGVQLPNPARGITLRNLTTHTSGFPRIPPNQSRWRLGGMWLFGTDPYAGFSQEDLFDAVRNVELEFTPGSRSSYSNFGVALLGCLLARKEGTNYESLVERDVCRPLGMTNTVLRLRDHYTMPAAQGYRAVWRCGPLMFALRSDPWLEGNDTLGGAGGLRSTGADMLNYLVANMRPDESPIGKALRETHQELFKENDRVSFGMNWLRTANDDFKQTLIWHNGGTGGFRSFLGFTEDGRAGVLILSNTSESVDELSLEILRDIARRLDQPNGHRD